MSRRAIFDYALTCPKIDREIERAKSGLANAISDLLFDVCPQIPSGLARQEIVDHWTAVLYEEISGGFEAVREANEDMRRTAERQIDDLASQVNDLEIAVAHYERSVTE